MKKDRLLNAVRSKEKKEEKKISSGEWTKVKAHTKSNGVEVSEHVRRCNKTIVKELKREEREDKAHEEERQAIADMARGLLGKFGMDLKPVNIDVDEDDTEGIEVNEDIIKECSSCGNPFNYTKCNYQHKSTICNHCADIAGILTDEEIIDEMTFSEGIDFVFNNNVGLKGDNLDHVLDGLEKAARKQEQKYKEQDFLNSCEDVDQEEVDKIRKDAKKN